MKKLFYILMLALFPLSSYAQITVNGKVSDGTPNEGIPGVNIIIKGTANGTTTDLDGNYKIGVPSEKSVLVFSSVGFVSEEILVGSQSVIDVVLNPDVTALSEVVVIGYGTSKKKELTGSVGKIDGDAISAINPTRMENALQGQIAGVNVTSSSSSPGGSQNIRIRGFSTNGDNNPLVVVDGVPYSTDGLSALNPNDIESLTVLKDATAGIYGVRAANGVIIVTTKKGAKNSKAKISFDGYYGLQETSNKLDVLNATEYAVLKNEAAAAGGNTPPFNNTNLGTGTDWQNEVFGTAPIQNYNLSARGGNDKSTYAIGGSYFNQEGIVGGPKSEYSRYNGRVNFSTDLTDKVSFENVLLYTHEERKTLSENAISSVLFNALNMTPTIPVFNSPNVYSYADGIGDVINPMAQMANSFNDANTNKLVGSLNLDWEINNDFTLSGRAGYNYANVDIKTFHPLVYYGSGKAQNSALNSDLDLNSVEIAPGTSIPVNNSVTEDRTAYFNYNLEAFLNYNKVFNDVHTIKATLGTSFFGDGGSNLAGTGFRVPYNSWEFADISATDGADLLNSTSSYQYESRLQSFFARAEYMYNQKYIFSALIRRDGSSRFGENNRFGYFPAMSAAWILSDEDFMNVPAIAFAKLRASYGISGNDKIDNFAYRGLLNGEGVYAFNDQLASGKALGTLGNPDLKWEETSQFNVGLDLGLFNDNFSISADYFIKTTKDLLFQPDVSGVLGAYGAGSSPPWVNAGEIRNQGIELDLGYEQRFANEVQFSVNYTVTMLDNEVISLPEGVDFYEHGAFGVGGITATRIQPGYPIGYFFGYKTDGVFQNAEEISAGATQMDAEPGDLKYVDLNGDNTIDFSGDTDKTMIGSPIPDFTMGLNLGVDYKGFDFAATVYGSYGNDILRNYERQTPLANLMAYRMNRWTGEGSSEEPRLTTGANRNNAISDYYVEDGSYIRIKNIQLGYTVNRIQTEKIGIDRIRVYAAVNNLFTFTDYKGYDPDLGSSSPLDAGIDYGFYPSATTYMFGLNLNF